MAKDPAFLFYPNDYIGGTMGMTFEEKGAYIELLMLQFNRGHMTSDMIGQTVGRIWDKVSGKFLLDENGLYYNERLELEIEKRKSFVASRKNNILGNNQFKNTGGRKTSHMSGHMTSHMENENENVNEGDKEDKKATVIRFIPPTVEEVKEYCAERRNGINAQSFIDFYEARGWTYKGGTKMKSWKAAVRTWENRRTEDSKPSQTQNIFARMVAEGAFDD